MLKGLLLSRRGKVETFKITATSMPNAFHLKTNKLPLLYDQECIKQV